MPNCDGRCSEVREKNPIEFDGDGSVNWGGNGEGRVLTSRRLINLLNRICVFFIARCRFCAARGRSRCWNICIYARPVVGNGRLLYSRPTTCFRFFIKKKKKPVTINDRPRSLGEYIAIIKCVRVPDGLFGRETVGIKNGKKLARGDTNDIPGDSFRVLSPRRIQRDGVKCNRLEQLSFDPSPTRRQNDNRRSRVIAGATR